jgi:LysM repeat protein
MMKRYLLVSTLICFTVQVCLPQSKRRISPDTYINTYKDFAINEMKRSGIPASITLAQGMLESDNGNSILTVEGNNHFGIKCHDWTGKAMYKDDDARNECFRKYNSASESFRDHSDFLLTKQRYNFLFEYKSTDYKNWAKGLKKAGYATNPKYDDKLINLIEGNKLYVYDQGLVARESPRQRASRKKSGETVPDYYINMNTRPIQVRNNIEYVVAKNGDTFNKLCTELEMLNWELLKYNELTKDSTLHDGQILYLQPKRKKADFGNEYHTVQAGETLYSVSQLYGIKTRFLLKLNNLKPQDTVKAGEILYLRAKKK